MDISKYLNLKYGEPYNCFTLVEQVRKDLGLETPRVGKDFNGKNGSWLLRQNMPHWRKREYLHRGEIGDIVLMSQAVGLPFSHCGVAVSAYDLLHILPGQSVTAMPITRTFYDFPGGASRWY